jgi:hypothetical protein
MGAPERVDWPALPYEGWKDTYATLHMWMQVVGKIALARAPAINHSWGIAYIVTLAACRHLLPHGERTFAIEFDFFHQMLYVRVSDGSVGTHAESQSDAGLPCGDGRAARQNRRSCLVDAGGSPDPIRFEDDTIHHIYDGAAALRWWQIVSRLAPIFAEGRCCFVGKTSPVHFFWGAFDLAVTRFSGRPAPPREGPRFMREAYSHEVISHGFWPGSGAVLEPAFYAYAVPEPEGLKDAAVQPSAAYYHRELGSLSCRTAV